MRKYLTTAAMLALLLSSVFVLNGCGDCDYDFLVGNAENCGFIADDLDCDSINFSDGVCEVNGCECVDEECDLVYPFDFDFADGCIKFGTLDIKFPAQAIRTSLGI